MAIALTIRPRRHPVRALHCETTHTTGAYGTARALSRRVESNVIRGGYVGTIASAIIRQDELGGRAMLIVAALPGPASACAGYAR